MSELFLPKPYARKNRADVKESGVRAYRSTPETVHLQIRLKGKAYGEIASVELTFDKARQLGEHIIWEAAER